MELISEFYQLSRSPKNSKEKNQNQKPQPLQQKWYTPPQTYF